MAPKPKKGLLRRRPKRIKGLSLPTGRKSGIIRSRGTETDLTDFPSRNTGLTSKQTQLPGEELPTYSERDLVVKAIPVPSRRKKRNT